MRLGPDCLIVLSLFGLVLFIWVESPIWEQKASFSSVWTRTHLHLSDECKGNSKPQWAVGLQFVVGWLVCHFDWLAWRHSEQCHQNEASKKLVSPPKRIFVDFFLGPEIPWQQQIESSKWCVLHQLSFLIAKAGNRTWDLLMSECVVRFLALPLTSRLMVLLPPVFSIFGPPTQLVLENL